MSFTYEYPRPAVTTDALIFYRDQESANLLLIQRGQEPYKGQWALPGGFINMDEDLHEAVKREIEEETGLNLTGFEQLRTFGKPDRDPRHRTVTVAFYIFVDQCYDVKGMDDAMNAKWFSIHELPQMAFDHEEIVSYAFKKLDLITK